MMSHVTITRFPATHDLVVRGGSVVDGSGGKARRSDVAVDDDYISAIGIDVAPGRIEVDATGCIVSPGFIDLHTHLDAQVGWDPLLTPCTWHGITTVLLGNCGVTFAPVRQADRITLATMMESVEDIPRDAILNGLPWTWESYGDYLAAAEQLPLALNVAGLVGHCAIRTYVMGEGSVDRSPTGAEMDAMIGLVRDSIDAGAFGFSTSRLPAHRLPDGRNVPGTHATESELLAIGSAMGRLGGAVFQNALDLEGQFERSIELVRREAETCGRAMFNVGVGDGADTGSLLAQYLEARFDGVDATGVCLPRGGGGVSSLAGTLPFHQGEWERLASLDLAGRLTTISDPAATSRLVAHAKGSRPHIALEWYRYLGDGASPDYVSHPTLTEQARLRGEHPVETWLDLVRQSVGRAAFVIELFNRNLDSLLDLLRSPFVIPGLGDAGAHVSQVMDAGWTTFMLTHWVRDTCTLTLEAAIQSMTQRPAEILGLDDRGRIEVGARADLNVIDLDALALDMPKMVYDFPGGAKRLTQRARGYRATIVNGVVNVKDGEHTGAAAGRVLRRMS